TELGDPVDTTFGGVLSHWAAAMARLPVWDVRAQPACTLLLAASLLLFLVVRDRSIPGLVMQALLVGGLVYLASMPNPTELRLEFVLFPVAAYAGSLVVEWAQRTSQRTFRGLSLRSLESEP